MPGNKVGKVMGEFKRGTLRSGSGKKVTTPAQAKAIALSYKKGGAVKKLTERQKQALKRHSEHHTRKHMTEMRKIMRGGKTFTEAHKIAMKRVGK